MTSFQAWLFDFARKIANASSRFGRFFSSTKRDDARKTLSGDAHPNTRYNAATGLTRHGDERAVRVLVEMLDPENNQAVQGEKSDSEKQRKRSIVLHNALHAAATLAEKNKTADLSRLRAAVANLQDSKLDRAIRLRATETIASFK